jgi:hypothetical protein
MTSRKRGPCAAKKQFRGLTSSVGNFGFGVLAVLASACSAEMNIDGQELGGLKLDAEFGVALAQTEHHRAYTRSYGAQALIVSARALSAESDATQNNGLLTGA